MKVTYEFNCEEGNNDSYELQLFKSAREMYQALSDIAEYLRAYRKGWNEDDAERMEDVISNYIVESNIGDLE